jgi:DNA-binding HxlR family transcriptional regulator
MQRERRNEVIGAEGCPITGAVQILGRKGMFLVVWELLEGPKRFNRLQDGTGLPPRTVSQRLKELGEAGLVGRVQYPEIPPRVEYTLTPAGEALRPVLAEIESWGATHLGAIPVGEESGPRDPRPDS